LNLLQRLISILCLVGGIVLDCFGGSGTTSVAAIGLERRSVYMECDPGYVEIAQRRFEKALAKTQELKQGVLA